MTDDLIEIVALAIFKRARDESDWLEITEAERQQWRADARAALAAIEASGPTDAMIKAGADYLEFSTPIGFAEIAEGCWRAMWLAARPRDAERG